MGKSLKFGVAVSLVLIVAAAAVAGFWRLGYNQGESATDGGTIAGYIEYTVRDASGNVKAHKLARNTTTDTLKNAARARLGVDGTTLAAANADLFDNIQACSANATGGACTLVTHTLLQVSGANANPADGTNTAGGTGVYTTVVAWTATGALTIEELQLTSGAVTSGTAQTAGAFQDVSITLANTDTLTVTWTITIS